MTWLHTGSIEFWSIMRNRNRFIGIVAMLLVLPASLFGQGSSINTFSPYTFYGVGDFSVQGPAYIRSMGGAGVGFRSASLVNTLNPAGLSSTARKTFLFNVGLEGQNFYSRSAEGKTSFSTFNIRDIALQFPVYEKMAVGINVAPLTNVGYRVDMFETNPDILSEIGQVQYMFDGEGGITQFKLSYGVQVFKRFSLGADLIYYKGQITRNFGTNILPIISGATYDEVTNSIVYDYSKLGFDVGVQYNIIEKDDRLLTFGATFQPKTNLRANYTDKMMTSNPVQDTVQIREGKKDFFLPNTVTAGLFYQNLKIGIGVDYSWQNWNGLNRGDEKDGIAFRNSNSVKAGIFYTPNRYDVRRFYNRWTYRAGFRYSDYYMMMNGEKIRDFAVTLGLGIPVRQRRQQSVYGVTQINVGAEIGRRGSTRTGVFDGKQFKMVRESYFKFSIEFSLFGEDYWFVKHRYN